MTVILVVGAGLLVKSFNKIRHVDPGFDPANLLVWSIEAPKDDDAAARFALFRRVVAAATVPGVVSISLVNHPPLSGGVETSVGVDGGDPAKDTAGATYTTIAPNYFQTMRIPLMRGRDFTDADMTPDAAVAIVSRAMVARYWPPNTDPVGHRMTVLNGAPHDADYRKPIAVTVVGVVGDVKQSSLTETKPAANVYMPLTRPVWHGTTVVARTAGRPDALIPTVRQAVSAVDPALAVQGLETYSQGITESTARPRFTTALLTAFSIVALILATLGIYGVISYAVSQRVGEIGIRMALGAQPDDVVRLIVRQATVFMIVGLAIGIFGAVLLARGMQGLLFGVAPLDPTTFVGMTALLGGITLVATYVPARRAAHIDPISALRSE
jgi:putative ABC transport system permease protein